MNLLKRILLKSARIVGIVAIAYASLVLYLFLSERRLAFPRAEADASAKSVLQKDAKTCLTDDGKKLGGWILNEGAARTVVYFPGAGEDAATFLAAASHLGDYRLVGFNYRGSAGSEGDPGEKHFIGDIRAIVECSGTDSAIFVGHGTGAIAAYNAYAENRGKGAVLIDPVRSFGEALSERYRIFFPSFLSRTQIGMNLEEGIRGRKATILFDDPARSGAAQNLLDAYPDKFVTLKREGKSLLSVLNNILSSI